MSRRARLALAVTLMSGASALPIACADAELSPNAGEAQPCVRDAECESSQLCLLGLCLEPELGELSEVDIHVEPPAGSEVPPQQFLAVEVSTARRVDLALRGTSLQRGVVRSAPASEEDEGVAEPARVVAVPTQGIAGRVPLVTVETDEAGMFELPLVESTSYSVRVYPDDPARPPMFISSPWVTGLAGGNGQVRNVTLPSEESLVAVSGTVLAGEGAGSLPVPGVEVRILEGASRVSSLATTGTDGRFRLLLAADRGEPRRLVVRPTENNPAFPTVVVEDLSFEIEEGASEVDVGTVSLGFVSTPVQVVGSVTGPDGAPVPGASVFLRADVGNGVVQKLISADANGQFTADLVPAAYDLVAVAPTDNLTAGIFRSGEPVSIADAEAAPIDIVLRARVAAQGRVTSEAVNIAGAALRLERLGPPGGGEEPVLGDARWAFTGTTNDEGAFNVAVDPGRYRVRVEPPAASGAPALTLVTDVFADPEELRIALPPPVHLAARLVASSTAPDLEIPEGAEIQVFGRFTDELGDAVWLGRTTADDVGAFTLVLPDLLAAPAPAGGADAGVGADGGSSG